MAKLPVSIFLLFIVFAVSYAELDSLYCGRDNCYDVLGVDRDTERGDIVKAYRKLARQWHPDRHRGEEAKAEAQEMFQKIANAYEILRDEDSRADYDYMLDNPEEYYYNYYRYYKTRATPKVDIRIVIAVTITVFSVVQYYGAWSNYQQAISYFCKDQKYRMQAINIAKDEGLLPVPKRSESKRRNKVTSTTIKAWISSNFSGIPPLTSELAALEHLKNQTEEIKEEEEAIIKQIIEQKMDIRGGYSKPSYYDVLWVQLFLSPFYLGQYVCWYLRWIWKFWILKEEYGEDEKLYLIRKFLKLKQAQFDTLEESEIADYMKKELWIKEKFAVWKAKKEEEEKIKLAESARYKAYRRYMKKGGPGQMVFGPE